MSEPDVDGRWSWDPSLYAGSAAYYARGRVPYPAALIDLLVDRLDLDGRGRLLDLGCGPGSLTVPLAPFFERVVAVDPDEEMIAEGARRAVTAGVHTIDWIRSPAEDLTPRLGGFRVATMAQSFHWMRRQHVAGLVRRLLPTGTLVFVHATTHQGSLGSDVELPEPAPPWPAIEALIAEFLGARRRAGRGYRQPDGDDDGDGDGQGHGERPRLEDRIFAAAGFTGPERLQVPGRVVTRSADQVVASVFSLSYAAPHLFGERVGAFEQQVRELLAAVSPTGRFAEQMREIDVDLWG